MCTRLFLVGVVALMLGIQFRFVDTFVLNERVSKVLAERDQVASSFVVQEPAPYDYSVYSDYDTTFDAGYMTPTALRNVKPPRWLGWSLISVGAVLVLTCSRFR